MSPGRSSARLARVGVPVGPRRWRRAEPVAAICPAQPGWSGLRGRPASTRFRATPKGRRGAGEVRSLGTRCHRGRARTGRQFRHGWERGLRQYSLCHVITRMSKLFVRTLREDPADAEVPSHRWLVRAGYIRRAAPGIYTWLPLGYRVLRKVERIVREEMDAIGAQEVHFPALLPREPYEATSRWTEYGADIFRLKDRKGGDYLLGPTHEEMFTLLVKDLYSSYKDLPLWLYQIQTKYRDEARPRAGLLRGREFVMKDSYSFDIDDAGLQTSYAGAPRRLHQDLRPARLRVRDRPRHVRRDGRLGQRGVPGRRRQRRGHLRPLARRLRGQRRGGHVAGARPDRRTTTRPPRTSRTPRTRRPSRPWSTHGRTPQLPARDDRPWTAADTLKNVVFMLRPARRHPRAAGHRRARRPRGRPEAAGGAARAGRGRAVQRGGLRRAPGAGQGLHRARRRSARSRPSGVRYLVDPRVVAGTRWVTGATSPAGTCSTWSPAATSPRTA